MAFMNKREEQLKIESEELRFQMMTEKITYSSKEQFITKILQRKYDYIFRDIEKQWKHLNKDKESEPISFLEVA